MRHAQFSHELFGRYHALLLYSTIESLMKPEFTTGELVALTGVSAPLVSKELGKLVSVGVLERLDYRGRYRADVESAFWEGVRNLVAAADAQS